MDIINELSWDLDVDVKYAADLVEKHGLESTARILGYNVDDYDYMVLSGRLVIESMRKNLPKTVDEYLNMAGNFLNEKVRNFLTVNSKKLDDLIEENAIYEYENDWFSANTLKTMYSLKIEFNGEGIELPRFIWLRVAVQLYYDHENAMEMVRNCHTNLSKGYYTPASPTMFNAGTLKPQMSSCFLLSLEDNLYSILGKGVCAAGVISQSCGGLGIDISNIRHSAIGQCGMSNGIIPMIQVMNSMLRYVDQGGNKRKGAGTFFVRAHHIDVLEFVELTRKVGDRYSRAHDINTCIITSDIFWKRVKDDGDWTFFCPALSKNLNNVYGKNFTKLYIETEKDPKNKNAKKIKARELLRLIVSVQKESGMPYLIQGCAINRKCNQSNMGYIGGSNLCLEINQYTDSNNIASCNLQHLNLLKFAKNKRFSLVHNYDTEYDLCDYFDFELLGNMTREVVVNLNNIIDKNYYPLDNLGDLDSHYKENDIKAGIIRKTNMETRPMAIGVCGFADLLYTLGIIVHTSRPRSYEFLNSLSKDNRVFELNKMIFACMYWNSLAQSVKMAVQYGRYSKFEGSHFSHGDLQFDLWEKECEELGENSLRKKFDDKPVEPSVWNQCRIILYDKNGEEVDVINPSWIDLKRCIVKYGTRNSLLTGLMPTASTSQIRRVTETVELPQNNMYSRKVLSSSYPILNRFMVNDMKKLGLWNKNTVEYLKVNNGNLTGIIDFVNNNTEKYPKYDSSNLESFEFVVDMYKTVWDVPQKIMIQLAADRSRYIDQSCSMNIYMKDCDESKVIACHRASNELGLKTICYYLRQQGADNAKFTVDTNFINLVKQSNVVQKNIDNNKTKEDKKQETNYDSILCTDEVCFSCT